MSTLINNKNALHNLPYLSWTGNWKRMTHNLICLLLKEFQLFLEKKLWFKRSLLTRGLRVKDFWDVHSYIIIFILRLIAVQTCNNFIIVEQNWKDNVKISLSLISSTKWSSLFSTQGLFSTCKISENFNIVSVETLIFWVSIMARRGVSFVSTRRNNCLMFLEHILLNCFWIRSSIISISSEMVLCPIWSIEIF